MRSYVTPMMASTATPPRSRGSGSSPGRCSRAATASRARRSRISGAWPGAVRSSVGRSRWPSAACHIDVLRRGSLDSLMPGLQMKRWKRIEYERLVDRGVFQPGDRLELIDGLLLVSEPQSSPHYTAIQLVERVLARAFGEGWNVRTQAPIALDDVSEPEPDR